MDDISRSVNLFRGQVVLPLELVSLPGRNGLDVGVTAIYSSAVAQQVGLRNRDAPTGTLGVGWSLGNERIVLGDRSVALGEQQRAFLINPTGVQALYRVEESNGIVTFQTREYQFWKVELIDSEDPLRARWRVTRDDGSVRLFGGGDAVEWGAAWDAWVGPSTAGAASPFPIAWNLAKIRSPEGDCVDFTYERDGVEIGGVAVTRASRLTRVLDVFGRTVELDYREKEQFENEFPEVPPAGATPAYQFSFQTHYLHAITVRERGGEIAFRQLLGYELLDVSSPPEQPVPELTKRYLTSVRQELPGEPPLPALALTYERDPDAPARGSLTGQTFVTGARVEYAYSPAPVPHSSTVLELDGPPGHQPRVWHGASFTVVTWHAPATGHLEVWVCAWSGVWRIWRDDTLADTNAADVSVTTGAEFFAVRYHDRGHDRPAVRLYHEDPHRFGHWSATDLSIGPELAELRMAAGGDFVALQGRGNAWMRIVQWNALRKNWREQTLDTPDASELALGGGDGFVLGAFHSAGSDQLRVQVFYADLAGQWRAGGYADVTQPVDWELTKPESVWSAGSALAAATLVTGTRAGTVSSVVALVRWRSDYALADVEVQQVTQPTDARNPLLYSVLTDALVGHAADVTRLDAGAWRPWRLVEPRAGGEYRYAYGADLALVGELRDGVQRFSARRYDPYVAQWTDDGAPPPSELGGMDSLFAPAITGQYAQLGRSVYSRSAEGNWESVHDLPESALGASCALRSGGYLSYERRGQVATEVAFLRNGTARPRVLSLPGERSYVPDPGPGEVLAGPSTLVTYRGDAFSSARTLTLHRVIDADMPAEPLVPAVAEATIDDGYARRSMRVEYDDEGAALDPTATTAQFTRVRVNWPSDPDRGSTLHTFYNGLEPDDHGAFYPPDGPWSNARRFLSLLSGQIWKSEAFDAAGALVSRVATLSWTYDRSQGPAGSVPADTLGESDTPNLAGFYTRARRSERTLALPPARDREEPPGEGDAPTPTPDRERLPSESDPPPTQDDPVVEVTSVETYDHNAFGQVSATTVFNLTPGGDEERLQTFTMYAWEVYDELRNAHLLTPVAQVERRNATTDAITGIDVTTYIARWPSAGDRSLWAPRDSYSWRGTEGTAPFDFARWSDLENPPPGWLLTNRVVDRASAGAALEQRDVDGVHTSVVRDRDDLFEVASLHATSRTAGEGWYWGFESYEYPGPWTVSDPAAILEGTAFAGARCLRVPGAADARACLTATLHCAAGTDALMLACRSHTPLGGGHGTIDAVWKVRAGDASREFQARASDGEWRLWHVPLHPADFGLERFTTIEIELLNRAPELELLLDCVFCNPLIGAASAAVYSEPHELQVAAVERLGPATWTLFDDLRRPIAQIGEGCESTTLTAAYAWQQCAERFDPTDPNFDLRCAVRAAGSYLNAVHGDSYEAHWRLAGAWQRDAEVMRHTGEQEGLILTAWAHSERTFALRARVQPDDERPPPYGLVLGGARAVRRDGRWVLVDPGGRELASAPANDPPERDLLALATDVGVQLFGDGRPLLDAPVGPLPRGPLGVCASGAVEVSQLVAADGVATEASYRDNLMRPIQTQTLCENGVIALASVLDGAARAAVQTRPLRRRGHQLGFMTDLVTSFDWSSGVLSGAAAEGYPADEGYPYGRFRYDATPLARAVETGLPGRALAINERVPAPERHTQRTHYEATNAESGALTLPAGGFSVTTSIDQDGVRTRRAIDRLGRPVREVRDNARDPTASPETRVWEYDDAGRLRTLWLPNAFDASRPDARRFRERFAYDFLGRLIEREQPDTDAPAQSVYDAAGRVRFAVDAAGLAAGTFTYCRYDELGRLLEDGVCPGVWDRAVLEAGAEDRDWLPPGAEPLNLRAYDGDGTDPYSVGRLVEALARRPGASAEEAVREQLRYDAQGRLRERTQTVIPDGGGSDRVRFAYDLQGETIEQRHTAPGETDRDGAFAVHAVRDPLGQIVRLQGRRGASAAEPFSAYTYTAEGQLDTETLASSAPTPLRRAYSYGPAGWLTEIQDACFSQRVRYDGSHAGRVTATEERFADPPPIGGFVDEFETAIDHDGHGRLRSVTNSAGENYGLGTIEPLSYDRNGNLLALSRGTAIQNNRYADGSNRLLEIAGRGTYAYDPSGALRSAPALGIESIVRHPTSGQPLRIGMRDGMSVDFGYTADGRRVLERGGAVSAIAVHGAAGRLLARRVHTDGEWRTIRYLHGPTGLAAASTDDRSLFVLRDRLGSVRAVHDGERLVAAASYQPLGDALGARWIDPALVPLLPQGFTGQQHGPPAGLVLFPARVYDPLSGRFDRIDPAGRHPSPYAYVGGAPLDFVDPDGEDLLGALLGILVGAALLIGGVAAIIASGGAATPGVAAAWTVGGSFLLGAGAASATYGFQQTAEGTRFNPGEWIGLTGLGGLFGAISGGAALVGGAAAGAIGVTLTAGRAFALELGLGIVTGAAEGYVSNGVVNVSSGRDFDEHWSVGLLSGAGGGAFGGATGGFFGRMVTVKNVLALDAMGPRTRAVSTHRIMSRHWPSHSVVYLGVHANGTSNAYEQLLINDASLLERAFSRPPTEFARFDDFDPGRGIRGSLNVSEDAHARALAFAQAQVGPSGGYSYLSNSCTTNAIAVLEQTGVTAPPWAYSPTTLVWWVKTLPR